MNLLSHALEVLRDGDSPHGLRDVACSALVAALEDGVATPPGTAAAIWTWIRQTAPRRWSGAEFRLGEIFDPEVFASALQVLRDASSGTDLRRTAIDVLAGKAHAVSFGADELSDLVDRPHIAPVDLAELIRGVHAARRLQADFLCSVRDRWFASLVPQTREASVTIAQLVARPEEAFWRAAAADSSEDVRFAVIQYLARDAPTGFAIAVLHARLLDEHVVDVIAELHRAMGTLLQRSGP